MDKCSLVGLVVCLLKKKTMLGPLPEKHDTKSDLQRSLERPVKHPISFVCLEPLGEHIFINGFSVFRYKLCLMKPSIFDCLFCSLFLPINYSIVKLRIRIYSISNTGTQQGVKH